MEREVGRERAVESAGGGRGGVEREVGRETGGRE